MPYLAPDAMYRKQKMEQPVDPGFWGGMSRMLPGAAVTGGATALGAALAGPLGAPLGAGAGALVGSALKAPVDEAMAATVPTEMVTTRGNLSPLAQALAARGSKPRGAERFDRFGGV